MSILDYAPSGYILMQEQIQLGLGVEEVWDESDVIIVDGPVAVGKSILALMIMAWQGGGSYVVPDNVLLKQITDEFPDLPKRLAKDKYICPKGQSTSVEDWTCEKQRKAVGQNCMNCHCISDAEKDRTSPYGVYTYYGCYANKRYRNLIVVDEVHKAVDFLRDLYTKRLWKHKSRWPDPCTPEVLHQWTKDKKKQDRAAGRVPDKAVQALQSNLNGRAKHSLAFRSREAYDNHMEDLIKIVPASGMGNALWPHGRTDKIVLMSATLSELDVYMLGLAGKRVSRVSSGSPIPPQNRPAVFTNEVRVTHENRQESVEQLVRGIVRIANNHPGESGIVHVPYSLAADIGQHLQGDLRYILHGRDDKQARLDQFLSTPGSVFIASGFAEGLSLSYDKARFNVITKAMFPNKQDPFVSQMIAKFPQWYAEQAVKQLLQAYGRVCRRPNDFGVTYILDQMAWELYCKYPHLFPQWFKLAVIGPQQERV